MIDIAHEDLITMNAAAALIPTARRGGKVSLPTLWRWSRRGVRGVVLETVKVGNGRYTTRAAVQRFIAGTNPPAGTTPPPRPKPASTPGGKRQADVEAELKRLGY